MAKRRRIIFKLLVFVLAGAIINVAVAWGIVGAHGEVAPESHAYLNDGDDPLIVFVTRRFGYENVLGCERSGTYMCVSPEMVRSYPRDRWWPVDSVAPISPAYGIASGWPALSLMCWRTTTWIENSDSLDCLPVIHWGLVLDRNVKDDPKGDDRTVPAVVPLRPLWPGFAINTIFYAAIVYALFTVPGAVRRRVRIKRGQCASCGYSLRGSPHSEKCPECGASA